SISISSSSFLFTAPATSEIYTLSLHDALPILLLRFFTPSDDRTAYLSLAGAWTEQNIFMGFSHVTVEVDLHITGTKVDQTTTRRDRKSTRLNSSHDQISYAVFCLKKKKKKKTQ